MQLQRQCCYGECNELSPPSDYVILEDWFCAEHFAEMKAYYKAKLEWERRCDEYLDTCETYWTETNPRPVKPTVKMHSAQRDVQQVERL